MRGIGVLGVELRELQLTFADNKTVVQLPLLSDGLAKDVYMSRKHGNAQEQAIVIKGLLVTMLPTCKVRYHLGSVHIVRCVSPLLVSILPMCIVCVCRPCSVQHTHNTHMPTHILYVLGLPQ